MIWVMCYVAIGMWHWGFIEGTMAVMGPQGLSVFEDRVLALGLAAAWPLTLVVMLRERLR